MTLQKILLKDYAYIRDGIYADQNWRDINASIGRGKQLILKTTSEQSLNRRTIFKYDISSLELDDTLQVNFVLPISSGTGNMVIHFSIYETNEDWQGDTVTWNDITAKKLIVENVTSIGLSKIYLTDYCNSLLKEGKKEFSIMVVRQEKIDNETTITESADLDCMPKLQTETKANCLYVKELCSDKEKNAEIWALAEKEYQNWVEKEKILGARAKPQINKINTPADQFSKISKYKSQSHSPAFGEAKTRVYADLKDIDSVVSDIEIKYDKFGGMMIEELKQEATGFFYSKKINNRWWLIDPMGYPYYIKGLDVLQYSFAKSQIQKEAMLQKYGTAQNWAEETTKRLKEDLYFSAASRPSPEITMVEDPLPVQQFLSFMSSYGKKCGINNSNSGSTTFSENNTMPVFDPSYAEFADEYARTHLVDVNNPHIIGYSLDNELPMDTIMLENYLTIDPSKEVNYYSYATAWTWLKNVTGKESPDNDDITPELRDKFRGFIWNKYFEVTTEAFRKYDPNHMIIGARFLTVAARSEWVMKVAGHYMDAITINWYFQWTPDAELMETMSINSDKPFIVTEFYAKAGDSEGNLANRSGAGFYVETQQDRADYYHNFTLRMLECQNMVGWYWLQYIDNDPNNGIGDLSSRDSNKGIISNTHNEYTVLTSAMAEINKNIYKITQYFDKKYSK